MAKQVTVGIDVGTFQVKVVVTETTEERGRTLPVILGTGSSPSRGMRHGYIINQAEVARSIKAAVSQAEKMSGVKIRKAYLAVGGVGLDEIHARGETVIGRGDSEVTDIDVKRAIENSEERAASQSLNKKTIHQIPIAFFLDGHKVLGRPQGMKGNKLEVEMLFVTTIEQHLSDLIATIEDVGISVIDVMASPIAAAFATLTKAQKIAGCILTNIGSETVSIVVYENNTPISVKTFPIGSTDITNDIALGFKVSLDDAEHLKRGAVVGGTISRKKLDDVIGARLGDIFDLLDAHLKKIGKSGFLPAGIILIGGGSNAAIVEDIAKASLKIPSKSITLDLPTVSKSKIKDSAWAVAYGLTVWGMSDEGDSMPDTLGPLMTKLKHWFKQFLP
jgi:cell division protein FtsA